MNLEIDTKHKDLVHKRKEQILAAAERIFATNGYRRTTVDHRFTDISTIKRRCF